MIPRDTLHISLAPFQGITQQDYRTAYSSCFEGLDAVYAPFISGIHPEKLNPSKFKDVLPFEKNGLETVPQLVSTDAREVLAAAEFLFDKGYEHLNWNMGCPFSRLANKKRGCGILPYPEEIRQLLDIIMPAIPLKLSIKARLGYKQNDELLQVINVLNDYPLKEIIIHPRIGTQLYKGEVNIDKFAECISISSHPVAYNGDIYHKRRYLELQQQFPQVQAWMIGRGALMNPFLAAQMKGISYSENIMREKIKNFHNLIYERLSERISHQERRLGLLKSVWYYMNGVFVNGSQYFEKIKVCNYEKDYFPLVFELMEQAFATDDQLEHYFRFGLKHIG